LHTDTRDIAGFRDFRNIAAPLARAGHSSRGLISIVIAIFAILAAAGRGKERFQGSAADVARSYRRGLDHRAVGGFDFERQTPFRISERLPSGKRQAL